eukprot:16437547-Heterocapsa_arctica.AAC.1
MPPGASETARRAPATKGPASRATSLRRAPQGSRFRPATSRMAAPVRRKGGVYQELLVCQPLLLPVSFPMLLL